jgi:hypothetical protein
VHPIKVQKPAANSARTPALVRVQGFMIVETPSANAKITPASLLTYHI